MKTEIYNDDCMLILHHILEQNKNAIIVTDPPFNINYKYGTYKDKLTEEEYMDVIDYVFGQGYPCAIVHYPEFLHKITFQIGVFPEKIVSWVYNANTPKQHRDIAFYNVVPNFKQVTQPYKNVTDKRIKERMARGIMGGRLYDWWNINQVKNVSKDKTDHPCQMPLEVMKNIVGILPKGSLIIDPFMGSGTTGVACKELGYDFIGIEMDENYFEIAKTRIDETALRRYENENNNS